MKNRRSVSLNLILIIIILILLTSNFAAGSNPGTATDPIVTQSYVEGRLAALNKSIDERLKALESNSSGSGASLQFQVFSLEAGQILHLNGNTQFILRSGEATAIGGQGGGLSDLTTGIDLGTGENITKNHLLLVPKTDGRGVTMKTFGWVMVSGDYSVE
ncbi:MAG: hypothetical protein JXR88_11170 [Clostridia bacterium]|nr:hypothetical protein [Clostridia bacterium]